MNSRAKLVFSIGLLGSVCLLLPAPPALADGLAVSTSVIDQGTSTLAVCTNSGVNTSSCTLAGSDPNGNIVAANATSSASYGDLGASAVAATQLEGGTYSEVSIEAQANSDAEDTLTVGGFSGTAFLDVTTNLAGSAVGTGTAYLQTNLLDIDNGDLLGGSPQCVILSSDLSQCTASVVVSPSDEIDLRLGLNATALASAQGSPAGGSALFSDTGSIVALLLVNASGDPITGATITSASGTTYPTGASVGVPEPSSLLLLGAGLLGLLALAARTKRLAPPAAY